MLAISNLAVDHGELRALWDVSFRVEQGERVALLGANGAGKSTTLGAIIGLYRPAGGTISYVGRSIGGRDPADNVEDGIALVPEGRRLFPDMTVRENLEMGAYVRGKRGRVSEALERCYALFPVLKEKAQQPAAQLSGGQQQMVAIGRALMGKPALLLLDEPSVGIAHRLKIEIFDVIKRIQRSGTAILMAEQDAQSALRIADRVYVLEHGRVGREGTAAELGADDYIRQAYLGVG